MTTERLNCNNCGAPLEVPASARFVTCNQCGAQLTIQRSGGATYTEAASGPVLREMADRLDELTRQNELARVDREWDIERESYTRYGRYGQRYRPTVATSLITGVVALVGGGIWIFFVTSFVQPPGVIGLMFPLFGVFFMVFGVGVAIYNYNLAQRYGQGLQRYQERRRRLLEGGPDRLPSDDDRDRPTTFTSGDAR